MYVLSDGDEATFVRRCLEGDSSAFRPLVERYHRPLFRVARRMLGNTEDARDSTQTAFVKAYEHLATFDPRQRFFSWIYRILMNECLNVLRGRRQTEVLDPLLAGDDDPLERVQSAEARERVRAALLRLTPEHREVLVLRHFAELSYSAIAEAIALPEKTVKSRLFSARQRLAELLLVTAGAPR